MSELTALRPVRPAGLTALFGLAAATIVVAGLRASSGLVGPVLLALVLSIAVHPMRRWLTRMHLPGWAAALVCVTTVYLIVVVLAVAMALAVAQFASLLPAYQAQFQDLVDNIGSQLNKLGIEDNQVRNMISSADLSKLAGPVESVLGATVGIVSNLLVILTMVLFLIVDATVFPRLLRQSGDTRAPLVDALTTFAAGTRSYLLVSTVFGLIVAVIDTGLLYLLGIPVPILWGLLAFITNYIPNIGFVIGLVPPAVLGLLEGGPGLCLAVVITYSVINVVIQSVIQPRFVGDAVGLSTSLTFISLIFWAWVLGPLGALLAIPLSLLARALLVDLDPQARWMQPLLSNREAAPPAPADGGPVLPSANP